MRVGTSGVCKGGWWSAWVWVRGVRLSGANSLKGKLSCMIGIELFWDMCMHVGTAFEKTMIR